MTNKIQINDPVHGQIEIDPVALAVIEHPYFQRLRRVKALGFLDRVFPGAKHSRFEHSIGTYHVAKLFCKNLKRGTIVLQNSENVNWNSSSPSCPISVESLEKLLSETRIMQISIAALLHDVGHGPFSHASEPIMPSKKSELVKKNKLPPWLKTYFSKNLNERANHEDYSVVLMWKILLDLERKKLITELDLKSIISVKTGVNLTSDKSVDSEYKLLQQIVDGEFDSDRMDYLLRDSLFCGVPYGKYDLNRVLEGLSLVESRKGVIAICLKRSSLGAFEDFLFARYQMHVQIYTHRVDVACNVGFEKAIEGQSLPAKIERYVKYDDESFISLAPKKHKKQLEEIILNRNLWKTIYESFEQDQSASAVVCKRIADDIGTNWVEKKTTDKPFRKEKLLDLPVITKDMTGRFITQRIKALSDIIAHYNTSYFALRLCVSPEKLKQAADILKSFNSSKSIREIEAQIATSETALLKLRKIVPGSKKKLA